MPFAENLGTGGGTLDAQYGSVSTPNTNAPLLLEPTPAPFVYLPGLAGNYVSVPDAPALDITGDIEIVCRVSLDDWTPSSSQTLIGKWGGASQRSWRLDRTPTSVSLITTPDGTVGSATSGTVTWAGPADGTTVWLRTRRVAATGATTFAWAADQTSEPSSWTTIGTASNTAGNIFAGTDYVEIGSTVLGSTLPMAGKFFRAIIRNGIGGTTVLDLDFATMLTTGAEVAMSSSGPGSPVIPAAEQTLPNLGWGGSALDATLGSGTGTDTNDPKVLAHSGTNYLYLPGVGGNTASTPDSAVLDLTGDVEIVCRLALSDLTTYGTIVAKGTSYLVYFDPTGPRFVGYGNGTFYNSSALTISAEQRFWFKFTRVAATGAVNFYTAADQSTEPSVWTPAGSPTAGAGNLIPNTAELSIGSNVLSGAFKAQSICRAIVRNGIGGTVAFDADFTTSITSGGQTTFTESSTNAATVTINRSTSSRKAVAVVRPTMLFGTDDYCFVADNDLLDFGAGDSFTVVSATRIWNTMASGVNIVNKRSGVDLDGWVQRLGGGAFTPQTVVDDGADSVVTQGGNITAGALVVITGVIDRAAVTGTTYRDTTAGIAQSISTIGSIANSYQLRIGGTPDGSTFADMEFFGAAVFRRALSAAEIALVNTHYQSGATTASRALLSEAVLWLDPAERQVATINRAASGRKSVSVVQPVWLLGTDDFFQVVDSLLLDMGASNSFTLLAALRQWRTPTSDGAIIAKAVGSGAGTTGWRLRNGNSNTAEARAQINDGTINVSAPTGQNTKVGQTTIMAAVRDVAADNLKLSSNNVAGTPATDTTTGSLANSETMRIGRYSVSTNYVDMELFAAAVIRRALSPSEIAAIVNYYGG